MGINFKKDYEDNNELNFANSLPDFNMENFHSGFGGSLTKGVNYVSLKKPSIKGFLTSKHFGEYFQEVLTNSECKYGSYLDGKIKSESDIPNAIKIMVKDVRNNESVFGDKIACRVLNKLGIYTYYSSAHRDNDSYMWNFDEYDYFYSIFFEKDGYDFASLYDIEARHFVECYGSLDTWMAELFSSIKCIFPNISNDSLRTFLKDVAMSKIVRGGLIGDMDIGSHNIGAYINKARDTIEMAPNYDMEFAFRRVDIEILHKQIKTDIKYAIDVFPNDLKQIMLKVHSAVKNNAFDSIVDNVVPSKLMGQSYKEYLNNNANYMLEVYSELLNNKNNFDKNDGCANTTNCLKDKNTQLTSQHDCDDLTL